jgi:peptidoglycan/LPS O-acetylase OafA/YrhL
MNNSTEQDINALLHSRTPVPANNDLPERIIAAARLHKQRSSPTYMQWLYGIFSEFIRIEPAYIVCLLLVSGLYLGFGADWLGLEYQSGDVQEAQFQDYFYLTRSYL